ncbi:MAG TPA: hypothetical protein VN776_01250 [Terracidiphilus sp.]|nr:hypothetical protein [Terracidiphilus sp.]
MLFYCNQLKPLQRRSGGQFGTFLILTMLTFASARAAAEYSLVSKLVLRLIELLPTIPVAAMIFIVGRYLKRETDEFVRMLVTQSLLWGLGVTMIGDIVFGVVFENFTTHGLSQIYNIDVFCITALAALFIQLRRNQ